jgi:hypothetical protein
MKKLVLTASAMALAFGFAVSAAEAGGQKGVVNQNLGVNGNKNHLHANNIRLCNNRCTISGDYSGNIVGIGNQNLGPTGTPGKKKGHEDKSWR